MGFFFFFFFFFLGGGGGGGGGISENIRLILGRDIWGYRCATSWCDLDFDLAIVTLTFKILCGLCIVLTYFLWVVGTIILSLLYLGHHKV